MSIPQNSATGYVYLVRMGDTDYYKVGITSTSIEQRIAGLQTSTPFPLSVISTYPQEKPRAVEYTIHRALSEHHVRNEWFQCDHSFILDTFNEYNSMAIFDTILDADRPTLDDDKDDWCEDDEDAPIRIEKSSMSDTIRELTARGMSVSEIVKATGFSRTSVAPMVSRMRRNSK